MAFFRYFVRLFVPIAIIVSIVFNFASKGDVHAYVVTRLTGAASVKHVVKPPVDPQDPDFANKLWTSEWQPIQEGMILSVGDIVKMDGPDSVLDVMVGHGRGVRIKDEALVQFREQPVVIHGSASTNQPEIGDIKTPAPELRIAKGRLLSRVLKGPTLGGGRSRLAVRTPVAVLGVRGTIFFMDYDSEDQTSSAGVLEGEVRVMSALTPGVAINVTPNRKTIVRSNSQDLRLEHLSPIEKSELRAADDIKLEPTFGDKMFKALNLKKAVFDPMYNGLVIQITEYEMEVFKRTLRANGGVNNQLPVKLTDIELESGDYQDPWDSDYYYERFSPTRAALASAGPDRILHSSDDIIRFVQL
ncbi:MAG: FecR domain-containing protein [Magnetococcales bacterium]|nr:FecR domain-containing protein [Magnetococcales bacterium]